ncbi:hypothetical protein NM208_g1570 [Fusarium decemcellulare]|uniref:Uncharacterized protein n=1 Tax=Fusarium decemcellulare TaxID=57161 RepID=A0ACC1SVP9_9HYPO|nr:hypothetical protein NM208_g1570 [Fusarium decemcellulare]
MHTTEYLATAQARVDVIFSEQNIKASSPFITRHLDLLPMMSNQKELLRHWSTYLSAKLALTDGPTNKSRSQLLPMALDGIMSNSKESSINVTIFHAICACSAYNLSEITVGNNQNYKVLALKHDMLALTHLRHNMLQQESLRSKSLELAILTCMTMDIVSGTPGRWRTHIAGGMAYLNHLHQYALRHKQDQVLPHNLLFMAIMSGWDIPTSLTDYLDVAKIPEYSEDFSYAPAQFFRHLSLMNDISLGKKHLQPQELDDFERQLCFDAPQKPNSADGALDSAVSTKGHATRAFNYASQLFFKRTIRSASLAEVQGLVQAGIDELEAVDASNHATAGCMTMWPAIVFAIEASTTELQQRTSRWLKLKSNLGFRNLAVLHEAVERLRLRRQDNTNQSEIGWWEFATDTGFDVLRL